MLGLENPEEILLILDRYTAQKQKDIPKELDEYLSFVARTGDPVYNWSTIQYLFREKLTSVIREFHDTTPSIEDLPPCPNVDAFNYENLKAVLLERLDLFNAAPFTVQRLCELLTNPKKHYCRLDKFMRALEKTILVVSTIEPGRKKADSENGDSLSLDVSLDSDMDRDVGASAAMAVRTLAANEEVSTTPSEDEMATDGSQEDETAAAVASVVDPCSEVAANIVVSSEEPDVKIDDEASMAEAEAAEAINDDDGDVEVKDSLDGVSPVLAIDAAAAEVDSNGAVAEMINGAEVDSADVAVAETAGDDKDVQIDVVDEKPATAAVADASVADAAVAHEVVESSAAVPETATEKTDDTVAADGAEAMQADDATAVESSTVVVAAEASAAVESTATSSDAQCEEAVSSIADGDITDSASVTPPVKVLTSGKHALDDDDDDDEADLSNAKSAKIARLDDSVSATAPQVESSSGAVTADTSAAAVDVQTAECSSTTEAIAEASSDADDSSSGTEAVAATAAPIVEEPNSESMANTDSTVAAAADSADGVVISEISEAEAVTLPDETNENSPLVLEPDSSSPKESPDASDNVVIEELPATSDAPVVIAEAVVSEVIAAVVESSGSTEVAAEPVVSNVIDDATIEDVSTSGNVAATEPAIVAEEEKAATGEEPATATEQMAVEEDAITGGSIEDIADKATPSPPPTDAAAATESNEAMEATPIIPAAVADSAADTVAVPSAGEQMDVDESNSADSMDI